MKMYAPFIRLKKYTCILAGLLLLCTLFSACSKKKSPGNTVTPDGNYYITATCNGVVKTFDVDPWFTVSGNDNRVEHLVFSAYEKRANEITDPKVSFGFDIWRMGDNIGAGGSYINGMTASYDFFSPDGKEDLHNFSSVYVDPEYFEVNITQLDSKTLKGTFHGTLQEFQGGIIEVTEGTFCLPKHY